jgi:hypothetical protein
MNLHHRLTCAAAATLATAAMVLAAPTANATPLCVWMDDTGRTQVTSVVPDPYKAVATCTDSQKYELSPQQQRAAEKAKAAREDRARLDASKLPESPPSFAPHVAGTASQPVARRPVEVVTEATDCPTWWRLYDESAACFGPYRTTRGATRVEAFEVCNVIPSPEPKCGPRSN